MDFIKLNKHKKFGIDYVQTEELPIGILPYDAIHRGSKYEIFLRRYPLNVSYRQDFKEGRVQALLMRYPDYIDYLYENAIQGKSYVEFFEEYPSILLKSFEYLFPHLIRKLDKLAANVQKLDQGVFGESKLRRLK